MAMEKKMTEKKGMKHETAIKKIKKLSELPVHKKSMGPDKISIRNRQEMSEMQKKKK